MTSITGRMLIANTTAILAIHVLSFTVLYLVVSTGHRVFFDRTVLDKLELFVQTPELHDVLDPGLASEQRMKASSKLIRRAYLERYAAHPFGLTYLQVWDESGKELFRSPTIEKGTSLCDPENLPTFRVPFVSTWELPNGNQSRKYVVAVSANDDRFVGLFPGLDEPFESTVGKTPAEHSDVGMKRTESAPEQLVFAIARDASVLIDNRRFLRNVLMILAMISVTLLAGVTCVITRRGMAPLRHMARKIELLDDSNLRARIEMPVFTELLPIQEKLNEYLRRVEAAFERERGFSHDVAHELRTPLSALKMKLGFGMQKSRSQTQYKQLLDECMEVTDHLDQLVHRILYLAQLEFGQYKLEIDDVNVSELLPNVWKTIPSRDQSNCHVFFEIDTNCQIRTELVLLHQLLTNVFFNARQYVNDGGRIQIRCRQHAENMLIEDRASDNDEINKAVINRKDIVEIEVQNSGSTITTDQVELVFSRFWRGCKSRSVAAAHSGLGLTIADRIATALGGTIAARSENGNFVILIQLPKLLETNTTISVTNCCGPFNGAGRKKREQS